MKLKNFCDRFPIISVIIILIIFILFLNYNFNTLNSYLNLNEEFCGVLNITIQITVLILVLNKLDFLNDLGILKPRKCIDLIVVWPMILVIVVSFCSMLAMDFNSFKRVIIDYGTISIDMGLGGAIEELVFRGLILGILLRKYQKTKQGIFFSIVLSSILFSLLHINNFFANPNNLGFVINEIIWAFGLGVFFAICRLRNNSIIPIMIMHCLFNLAGSLRAIPKLASETALPVEVNDILGTLISTFVIVLYSLFLFRKVIPPEAIASE